MLTDAPRPRVSRETRRLLSAAALALIALWVLARLRFPERPISPNPVAPVLTQISPPASFAELSSEIEAVRRRIAPIITSAAVRTAEGELGGVVPAWPWREAAIAMLPVGGDAGDGVLALDRPTGLALMRTATASAATGPIWTPERLAVARYVFAAVPGREEATPVPVYISAFEPLQSPAWSSEVWSVPASMGLTPGALLFTAAGEWIGAVGMETNQTIVVPAAALLDRAMRLSTQQAPAAGSLGIEVHNLTPALAALSGATTGVIVSWVDPAGAAKALAVGDVIERINSDPVPTARAWQVRTMRLAAGAAAALRVRRRGQPLDLLVLVPPATASDRSALGVTLTREAGTGARVQLAVRGSAAAAAGLRAGDVITWIDGQNAPTPAQVQRAFAQLPRGGTLAFAFLRDGSHRVAAITR